MSRKTIGHVGPQIVEEESISFDKREDGYYQKRTDVVSRDLKTGLVIGIEKNQEEVLYEVTKEESFDHQMPYQDENGNLVYIRFKKVQTSD